MFFSFCQKYLILKERKVLQISFRGYEYIADGAGRAFLAFVVYNHNVLASLAKVWYPVLTFTLPSFLNQSVLCEKANAFKKYSISHLRV